jgi:tetratricopeptide (TPR) repeat protein
LGPDHPETFSTMSSLAVCYHNQKKSPESIEAFEKALAGSIRDFGKKNQGTLWIMLNLGSAYTDLRPSDAEDLLRQASDGLSEILGPTHQDTLHAMSQLAYVYGILAKPDKAEPLLNAVLKDCRSRLGPEHPETLFRKQSMAACYLRLGKLDEAEQMLRELVASRRRRTAQHEEVYKFLAIYTLAQCYIAEGKHGLAEPLLVEAIDGRKRVLGANQPETLEAMDDLGVVRTLGKELAKAEDTLRECLGFRINTTPEKWSRFNTESLLGGCISEQKRFREAEPILLSAYEALKARQKSIPAFQRVCITRAAQRIVRLYGLWGDKDKATHWMLRVQDSVFPDLPFAPPRQG